MYWSRPKCIVKTQTRVDRAPPLGHALPPVGVRATLPRDTLPHQALRWGTPGIVLGDSRSHLSFFGPTFLENYRLKYPQQGPRVQPQTVNPNRVDRAPSLGRPVPPARVRAPLPRDTLHP